MVLLKRSLRKEENKKRIQKTNFFIDVINTDDKLSTYIGFKVKNNIKDWVLVYKLGGCGFESCYYELNLKLIIM